MANSDKNIVITPNIGQTSEPTIVFTGANNNPVTLRVLDDGTLSVGGSSGQLFSISDDLTGTIFSVNDISGIPLIEATADAKVNILPLGSGNLGIGISNPLETLDVNGDAIIRGSGGTIGQSGGGWTNAALRVGGVNAGLGMDANELMFYGTGKAYIGSLDSGLGFYAGGSERMTLSDTGNLSIGTTSAFSVGGTARLTVAGGNFTIGTTNSDLMYVRRQAQGQFAFQSYYNGNTGNIQLNPYGGTVGIGTDAPSFDTKFDIGGNTVNAVQAIVTRGQDPNFQTRFINAEANNVDSIVGRIASTYGNTLSSGIRFHRTGGATTYMSLSTGDDTQRLTIGATGNVGIGTTNPLDKFVVSGTAGQLFSVSDSLTGTIFSVNDVSGVPSIEVIDDGTIILAEDFGKVGVGISSPISKLHVYDATGSNVHLRVQNGSGSADYYKSGGDLIIGNNSAGNVRIWNNNLERMRIDSSGKVGIGTTTPSAKLDVLGNAKVGNTGDGGPAIFTIGNSNGSMTIEADDLVSFYKSDIGGHRFEVDGTEVIRFTSTDRVGIGTTNPAYRLEVAAPGGDGIAINTGNALIGKGGDGGDTQLIYWGGSTNSVVYYGRSSLGGVVNQHEFRTNGTTRLTVDETGNVGIGTTTPGSKLTLLRSIEDNDWDAITIANQGSWTGANNKSALINVTDSSDISKTVGKFGIMYGDGQGAFVVKGLYYAGSGNYNASGTVFFARANGSVGISTTSPYASNRLHISGASTSPSLTATTPADISLIVSNLDTSYGTMFATDGSGKGYIQQRRTNNATYYDLNLQAAGGDLNVGGSTTGNSKLNVYQAGGNGSNNGLLITAGNNSGTFGSNQIVLSYNLTNSYAHSIKTRHNSSTTANNAIDFYVWKLGDSATTIGGQHVMSLDNSDTGPRVGIGTTDPTSTFEIVGTEGQLFSVTNSLSGTIFSVSDISGIPLIEADDDGTIRLAEFGGEIQIGGSTASAVSTLTSGTTVTIDTTSGDVFELTLTSNTTIVLNNSTPSGYLTSKTLIVTQGGDPEALKAITWPASVKWAEGQVPTLSTGNGAVDIFSFVTKDGGTTWYGFISGQSFS